MKKLLVKKTLYYALAISMLFSAAMPCNVLASHDHKTFQAAKTYEAKGDYKKALETFTQYLKTSDDIWSAPYARAKLIELSPVLETYYAATGAGPVYTEARFEPQSGVLFGATKSNNGYSQVESLALEYLEFGDEVAAYHTPKPISVVAWNTDAAIYANPALLDNIAQHESYINKVLDDLDKSGSKVLLRFANEMNVGPNGDPNQDDKITPNEISSYINAFRFVAERAKLRENIAMVWAPNDIGAINRSFKDYYPGNEYVDWIGVSMYPLKYFQAHSPTTEVDSTYFFTGAFANPVVKLANIDKFMKENNINKPLIITEGAIAHKIHSDTVNEDTTGWAAMQMRRMYEELPRYYPNLKAICYFNNTMSWEKYNYALYESPEMAKLYVELTNGSQFIKDANNPATVFKTLEGAAFTKGEVIELSSVAYYPYADNVLIEYWMNGNKIASSEQTPYKYSLDTSAITAGIHKLTVKTCINGKSVIEKSFSFTIN